MHFVEFELDHGPIVAQSAVPVLPDDTEETLAARVLAQEHLIYPQAVRSFVEDRLKIGQGKVRGRKLSSAFFDAIVLLARKPLFFVSCPLFFPAVGKGSGCKMRHEIIHAASNRFIL